MSFADMIKNASGNLKKAEPASITEPKKDIRINPANAS
jgi:hypothetical protein